MCMSSCSVSQMNLKSEYHIDSILNHKLCYLFAVLQMSCCVFLCFKFQLSFCVFLQNPPTDLK